MCEEAVNSGAGVHTDLFAFSLGSPPTLVLRNVCVAVITSTVRSRPADVPVGGNKGLNRDSVVNCDDLVTVPKSLFVGSGDRSDLRRLDYSTTLSE